MLAIWQQGLSHPLTYSEGACQNKVMIFIRLGVSTCGAGGLYLNQSVVAPGVLLPAVELRPNLDIQVSDAIADYQLAGSEPYLHLNERYLRPQYFHEQ